MPSIYDPNHAIVNEQPYLTIGSLVTYGSVANCGKNRQLGIIIGVETYNFGVGECIFLVYTNGQIVKTSLVFLVI
mgnify:CR=1 FL=1|tara:strand:+ start:183 stop:407 length:225 start_codon:yes stop_codon:yes gene_type:complete